jgi:2-dehydropantoate 2-reductase
LKTLIAGAGRVGGYLAALLTQAAHPVTVLARSEHANALTERGLRLRSGMREEVVARPRRVVTSLSQALDDGPYDWVVVAVRTVGLPTMVEALAEFHDRLLSDGGALVCTLNGLDADAMLARSIGGDRVVGAVVNASVEAPSVTERVLTSGGEILVAPLEAAGLERASRLAAFFKTAGIPSGLREDLRSERWRKLVWNSGLNAVTALTRVTMAEAARQPGLRRVVATAMTEAASVAAAEGVVLPALYMERLLRLAEKLGTARSSMEQDVAARRPTEWAALNGAVSKRGRMHGVPTPVNDTLAALLEGLTQGAGS